MIPDKNRHTKKQSIFDKYIEKHIGEFFIGIIALIGIFVAKNYLTQIITVNKESNLIMENNLKISSEIIKNYDNILQLIFNASDSTEQNKIYNSNIDNMRMELNGLKKKYFVLKYEIDSLSIQQLKLTIIPEEANNTKIPFPSVPISTILNDSLLSKNNPYPKHFDAIRIGNTKVQIDSTYKLYKISESPSIYEDKDICLTLTNTLFTKICYRCKLENGEYITHSIEYFFISEYFEYFYKQCTYAFSAYKGKEFENDRFKFYIWKLDSGFNVSIKKWSNSTYSYIIEIK